MRTQQGPRKLKFMWLGIALGLFVSLILLFALSQTFGIPDGAEVVMAAAEVAILCLAGGVAGYMIDCLLSRRKR